MDKAKALYSVKNWANGFFDVSEEGKMTVRLTGKGGRRQDVPLMEMIEELRGRGKQCPLVLRFGELIGSRIRMLHEAFEEAIAVEDYEGSYHGVYPIKVNQQREVVEAMTAFGRPYQFGLEAGSKAELMAATSLIGRDAYLICNGYKDEEFVRMALQVQKMGFNVLLVVEMPREVDSIMKQAASLGVEPALGIRVRLGAQSAGYWQHSGGQESPFGLHITQLMALVDRLRGAGKLDWLRMLHFHQGSQIPNIHAIRQAAMEATRIYADLISEGAPMGIIDLGGGLAVDYEGTQSDSASSANYGMKEYCADVLHVIKRVADDKGVPHPDIITESGRAVVAHSSVFVFEVIDVNELASDQEMGTLPRTVPEIIRDFEYVWEVLDVGSLQECFNDTIFYRDQLRQMHLQGTLTLRERTLGEQWYARLIKRFGEILETMDSIPDDLEAIEKLSADFYYSNFSLFQSLPDVWGIHQLFPVVPLHRLEDRPTRKAVIADVTCDCDGRMNQFLARDEIRQALPVHELRGDESYYIGVFLVGAYQEALGGLHNLLGGTHVVGVELDENDRVRFSNEIDGDTAADVLAQTDYSAEELQRKFRKIAREAVAAGRISEEEEKAFVGGFEEQLGDYTYFRS